MIIIMALSVGLMFIISGLFGFGVSLFGLSGWGTFLIVTGIQLFIMLPINRFLGIKFNKSELKRLDKILQIQEIEGKQLTTLECSYCGNKNAMLIDVNQENEFICTTCKNKNKIILQFTAVQTTDPILTDLQTAKDSVYDRLSELANEEESNQDNIDDLK